MSVMYGAPVPLDWAAPRVRAMLATGYAGYTVRMDGDNVYLYYGADDLILKMARADKSASELWDVIRRAMILKTGIRSLGIVAVDRLMRGEA